MTSSRGPNMRIMPSPISITLSATCRTLVLCAMMTTDFPAFFIAMTDWISA